MKQLLRIFSALAALSASLAAQERQAAPAMSCAQVSGLVQEQGAAMFSTGPYTYERVVRDQSFCELESTTSPTYLATRDVRLCFAGYRCRDPNRGEGRSSN